MPGIEDRVHAGHALPEVLEFFVLRRACAAGTPAHSMSENLPGARGALRALCAAGRLRRVRGAYVLTREGEDRLEQLYQKLAVRRQVLGERILRLLGTLDGLDAQQIARALSASTSNVQHTMRSLTHAGLLVRERRVGRRRGRMPFVYHLASPVKWSARRAA